MTVRSGSTADSVKKYAFRYSRGWRTAYGDAEPADSVTELSLFPALKLPCHSVSAGQADEPVVYQERQGLPRHFSSSDNCVSRIPFLRSYLASISAAFLPALCASFCRFPSFGNKGAGFPKPVSVLLRAQKQEQRPPRQQR